MRMTVVARAAMVIAVAAMIVTVPAAIAAMATVIVVAAVVPVTATVMVMVAAAVVRGGQREAAAGEQGSGNEQAADEFHHGLLRGRRGRNGTAIDFGWTDRRNVRLNGRRTSAASFKRGSATAHCFTWSTA